EQVNNKKSIRLILSQSLKTLGVFLIPLILICPFIDYFFILFFGSQWQLAAQISIILMPIILVNFIVMPFTNLAYVLNKNKEFFLISILNTLIMYSVFLFAQEISFIRFIEIYSLLLLLTLLLTLSWLYYIYYKYEKSILK